MQRTQNIAPHFRSEHAYASTSGIPYLRAIQKRTCSEARLAGGPGPFFGGAAPGVGDLGLFVTVDIVLAIAPDALAALPGLAGATNLITFLHS